MIAFRPKRIKILRETHGETMEDMGARTGKTKQQINIWENGINSPSIENLVLICNTYDVKTCFFFDDVSTTVEETKEN